MSNDRATQAPDGNSGAAMNRVARLDIARGLAIGGMILFHFVRDLEIFGLVAERTTMTGGWALFARLIAGSFLFLAGVSLILAHGSGVRWGSFLRGTGVVAMAAAMVSAATFLVVPPAFVFFGILHAIVASRCVGLLFLRLSPVVTACAAVLVWVPPDHLSSPGFDSRWLAWTGLAEHTPPSLDFEPLLPWLAPFLAGMVVARLMQPALGRPSGTTPSLPGRVAGWAGRNSLAIYLLHQPVLLAVMWLLFR